MSDECRHYNDDTNECAETGGQCDGLPLQTEDCIVYLRAALADLRIVAEGLRGASVRATNALRGAILNAVRFNSTMTAESCDTAETGLRHAITAHDAWKKAQP